MRLTDQKIRGLKCKPNGKPNELSDGGYPLAIIATRRTKSFYFRGRQNGKSLRKKIGGYPECNLATARDIALKMKLETKNGELSPKPKPLPKLTPIQDTRPTTNEVFVLYMKDEGSQKKDGGLRKWQRYEKEVAGRIGRKKIADVTHDDLFDIVSEKYDAGFPQASNTIQADLGRFFKWSLSKGRRKSGLTSNPMKHVVKLASTNARTRYLSEQEIRWFFECLHVVGDFSGAFESLLYTAARKSEIMLAKWTQVAEEKLTIGDTKNSLPHLIWLHPSIRDNYFVYKDENRSKVFDVSHVAITKPMNRLRNAIREKASDVGVEFENFNLHDLRRTAVTHMSSFLDSNDHQIISYDIRDKILNHKPRGTQARHYDQYDGYAEKKAAWKKYGDWLEKIKNSRD